MNKITLDQLKPGESAVITGVTSDRLRELGYTPGERITVIAEAAFQGPLAVKTASGVFALRRYECADVLVRLDPTPNP